MKTIFAQNIYRHSVSCEASSKHVQGKEVLLIGLCYLLLIVLFPRNTKGKF